MPMEAKLKVIVSEKKMQKLAENKFLLCMFENKLNKYVIITVL